VSIYEKFVPIFIMFNQNVNNVLKLSQSMPFLITRPFFLLIINRKNASFISVELKINDVSYCSCSICHTARHIYKLPRPRVKAFLGDTLMLPRKLISLFSLEIVAKRPIFMKIEKYQNPHLPHHVKSLLCFISYNVRLDTMH